MTPPMNDIISPTGQRVYTDITVSAPPRTAETVPPAALVAHAQKTVESFYAQIDAMKAQAATAAASRAAYLFAPLSETP